MTPQLLSPLMASASEYDDFHGAWTLSASTVAPGESFGLVGESGSGKSTLLRAVCRPSARLLRQHHRRWPRSSEPSATRLFYRKVQMVFQDPYGSLHPRQTVDRLLLEPLAIHGFADTEGRIVRAL